VEFETCGKFDIPQGRRSAGVKRNVGIHLKKISLHSGEKNSSTFYMSELENENERK
jgi:hypothetical protein